MEVKIPNEANKPTVSGIAHAHSLTIYSSQGAKIKVNDGANLYIESCEGKITLIECTNVPIIKILNVSNISNSEIDINSEIDYKGSDQITSSGICWGLSPEPDVNNSKILNSQSNNVFSLKIINLIPNTTYHVRSFVTTENDVYYSNSFIVKTLDMIYEVGEKFQGGIIGYIYNEGDPGYIQGEKHGFIVTENDLSQGIIWYNGSYCCKTFANESLIGSAARNTNKIINVQGQGNYAAMLCDNLLLNGYSDWYLPTVDEVKYLNVYNFKLNNFSGLYWTSTEFNAGWNFIRVYSKNWITNNDINTGYGSRAKNQLLKVRAIRYF
jgi:hypothetical protein